MAANLLAAGNALTVYNRYARQDRGADAERGAMCAKTPAEACAR